MNKSQNSERIIFVPDMGYFPTRALVASLRSAGVKAEALPPADEKDLGEGRRHSSCKECVPYHLTIGSFFRKLKQMDKGDLNKVSLFMPDGMGPCRFGKYNSGLRNALDKEDMQDVNVFSPEEGAGYGGFGINFQLSAWVGIVAAAAFENISLALRTLAVDKSTAAQSLEREWKSILNCLESGLSIMSLMNFQKILRTAAKNIAAIPLKAKYSDTPQVVLTGEIYVRMTNHTTEPIVSHLVERDIIAVKESPAVWFKYVDHMLARGISENQIPLHDRIVHRAKEYFKQAGESWILNDLSLSGLLSCHAENVGRYLVASSPLISNKLQGEAVLTIGSVLTEVFSRYAGAVVIGPFACMPTRIATAILTTCKVSTDNDSKREALLKEFGRPPVVFCETDGQPLSTIANAQLDTFALVVKKVNDRMKSYY